MICNPPYGERLGQSAEALALHRAMPDIFRRLKTWSFFILTALPDFEAVVGQSATRRRKLFNGRIECTYFQFLGPKPGRGEEGGKGEREKGRKGRSFGFPFSPAPCLPCSLSPFLPFFPSRLRRALGQGPGAGGDLPGALDQAGAAPAAVADDDGHHLLPALRTRRARGAAGRRSLRGLPARGRVLAAHRAHAGRTRRLARPDAADGGRGAGHSAGPRVPEEARAAAGHGAIRAAGLATTPRAGPRGRIAVRGEPIRLPRHGPLPRPPQSPAGWSARRPPASGS